MNRFQVALTVCVFTAASAWAQAPNQGLAAGNAQSGQPATQQSAAAPQAANSGTSSGKNTISGCLKRGFANYQLSDTTSNAAYQIRGNGADFAQHENHVVQIQGIADPKDSQSGKTAFYAQTVQDSGQSCGPTNQQMAANAPAAGQAGSAAPSANTPSPTATPNSPSGSQASSAAVQSGMSQSGATATNNASASANTPASQASPTTTPEAAGQSAAAATNSGAASSTNSVPSGMTNQSATSGASTVTPNSQPQAGVTDESKGIPQAGTPQSGAIASPSSASTPQSNEQKFEGCVSGDANNLKLRSNGKTFRLQGDTRSVWSLIGHNVEVTGEAFGEKAIQMSAAKDLASKCSGK